MHPLTTKPFIFSNVILFVNVTLLYGSLLFRIIGKYIRQTQNKLQASSLIKQEESMNDKKNLSLLEKMMIQSIHSDDIATLLMDMIILGVPAVICNNLVQTK